MQHSSVICDNLELGVDIDRSETVWNIGIKAKLTILWIGRGSETLPNVQSIVSIVIHAENHQGK